MYWRISWLTWRLSMTAQLIKSSAYFDIGLLCKSYSWRLVVWTMKGLFLIRNGLSPHSYSDDVCINSRSLPFFYVMVLLCRVHIAPNCTLYSDAPVVQRYHAYNLESTSYTC